MSDFMPRLGSPSAAVVVTGGASGLGFASAHALAAVGRAVAIWDIDEAGARAAAREIADAHGVGAIGLAADLRDAGAIGPAAVRTREAIGRIGGIVHCAGTAESTYIDGVTPEKWTRGSHSTPAPSCFWCRPFAKICERPLARRLSRRRRSRLHLVMRGTPIYTAAKGAVVSLVKSMADDLAADGVRINALSPGVIDTPMGRAMSPEARADFERRIMLGRFGEPVEIGRTVRFLLSDEASYITGMEIIVDGGLTCSMRIAGG